MRSTCIFIKVWNSVVKLTESLKVIKDMCEKVILCKSINTSIILEIFHSGMSFISQQSLVSTEGYQCRKQEVCYSIRFKIDLNLQ